LNKKIIAFTILSLVAFAAVIVPLDTFAQSSNIGVYIGQITPSSQTGPVGTGVNILGSIYTPNNTYQIILGKTVVTTGKSEGYYVNANFTVPEFPKGAYALILRDVTINVNYSSQFTITTGYSINAVPSSLQEGGGVKLNVSVTGAQKGTPYNADITVQLPSSAGTYSKMIALGLANTKGTASVQVNFPDSSFQPNGSLTDYVGTYNIYFNQSGALAQNQFTVNFIDSTTYHRGQTVNIRATAYKPDQTATITITSVKTSAVLATIPATATSDGVITGSWVVSSDVAIGDYTVKIAVDGTQKAVQDTQTFTVPGYAVKVQTTNLAGKNTPDIVVQARDQATNAEYSATTGSDGIANLKLENGNAALTALWNGVNVGQTNVTITGEATFSLRCQLTDLKVIVKNTRGIAMPYVDINILYQYHPSSGGSQTATASGQTDSSGSYVLSSTLPDATYTVNASMYNHVFNKGNNTFSSLPALATSEVMITCPNENITINVVGYNQEAIPSARIELVELSNGLFYSATTNNRGAVTTEVTFGMYRARVYKDNILVNETNIEAFSASQKQIRCTLYGIQVSVSVVDFFGSPISNANVTLNGPETEKFSTTTQSDGTATFNNIIGGDMQIIAYAPGTQDGYQALTLTVNQPTTVQIKIDKYVALGSMLIPASSLFTIIIVLVAVVLFVLFEIYVRRRAKNAQPAS
jgi:hypothetical protein